MVTPPPNSSSNHSESWVFQQAVSSVVLVTFDPKDPQCVALAVENAYPLPRRLTTKDKDAKMKERLEECKGTRCCTGCILEGAPEGQLYVLTCVHSLDHVFSTKSPITAEGINDLFKVSILCDHADCKHPGRSRTAEMRDTVPAVAVHVDCSKDLLLLRVEVSDVKKKCKEPHQPLKLAQKFPDPLERTVMISWPPYRPRTACVGEISHPSRDYSEIMFHAPKAHSANLSEVNILGDRGSSGAPLLDEAVGVAGVFHSGAPGTLSYSYFIAFNDLRNTLIRWGVVKGEEVR